MRVDKVMRLIHNDPIIVKRIQPIYKDGVQDINNYIRTTPLKISEHTYNQDGKITQNSRLIDVYA